MAGGEERSWTGRLVAGRYRVHERVAVGGMGAVYRATHEGLGRTVALKTFRSSGADPRFDPETVFSREAMAAAQIRHPNAAEVYDYGHHEGRPYIAMEWLEGETLRQRIRRSGKLEATEALRIALGILGALERVHELGMVHRDIKPGNVVLLPSGEPKLLDFGLVQWTEAADPFRLDGFFVGSPQFMPPEQILSRGPLDSRADIYAFGGLLHFMLSGAPPFDGKGEELLRRHLDDRAPTLTDRGVTVSDELERVVQRCLHKSPERRFASTSPLRAALEACPEAEPQVAEVAVATGSHEVDSSSFGAPGRRRRGRWLVGTVAVGIASGIVWGWGLGSTTEPGPPTLTEAVEAPSIRAPAEPTQLSAPAPPPPDASTPTDPRPPATRPPRRTKRPRRGEWPHRELAPTLRDPWADE